MDITARDIIKRWPSRAEMASDAGANLQQIHDWWRRDKINPEHDLMLVRSAGARGIDLTLEDLAWTRVPEHIRELLTNANDNRHPANCADSMQPNCNHSASRGQDGR